MSLTDPNMATDIAGLSKSVDIPSFRPNKLGSPSSKVLPMSFNSKHPVNYGSVNSEGRDESRNNLDEISLGSMLSPIGNSPSRRGQRVSSEDFSIVSDSLFQSGEYERTEALLLDDYDNVPVSDALDLCTRSVVKPYNYLLKIVGWRKFRSRSESSLRQYCNVVINWLYLGFIIISILAVSTIQLLMCLRRDVVDTNNNTQMSTYHCDNTTAVCEECLKHSITAFFIPDLLLFIAYIYALYIFRFEEPDYLQMLTETVFLSQASQSGSKRQKKLILSLRSQLGLGIAWMVMSIFISVFRLVAREVTSSRTPPLITLPGPARITLEVICSLGFIIFDAVYVSIVMNYSFQCQLLMYHIKSIKYRVICKEWAGIKEGQTASSTSIEPVLEKAIKELEQLKAFFIQLNRHISWAVSLLLFIFITSIMDAFVALIHFNGPGNILIAVGIFNLVQWVAILSIPLFQGARLSSSCASLKRLGHQIRARPLPYTETSFLHLDSFLTFISSQQLNTKFFMIPVTPGRILGLVFLAGCVVLLLLQIDYFSWATYL